MHRLFRPHLQFFSRPFSFSRSFSDGSESLKGNGVLGIRREDKNRWERRAPLAPSHVAQLVERGVKVVVQPSSLRIFSDEEYENVGAVVQEDLSPANTILGVKEVPPDKLIPYKTYCFFSHTIKAQAANMFLLDTILKKNVRLIDYERIVDADGNRLVKFGKYAGIAGTVDFLHGLGNRLLALGYSTPFLHVGYTHMYSSLDSARAAVKELGRAISKQKLPAALSPFTIILTGTGSVSSGVREILQLLPVRWVKPSELPLLFSGEKEVDRSAVYCCVASSEHVVERLDGGPFSRQEYYHYPDRYRSVFHERIAPYARAIINGIYWEERFPRLLTLDQIEQMHLSGLNRLIGVSDISCDVEGSIECLFKTTSIDRPFFLYDPTRREIHDDIGSGPGIMFLAVDNLPTEIPYDASQSFGDMLMPWIEPLVHSDGSQPLDQQSLPSSLRTAVITSQGSLTEGYEYISSLRRQRTVTVKKMPSVLVVGSGLVAAPVVQQLRARGQYKVTVASNDPNQTLGAEPLDVSDDRQLRDLVGQHDLVVSLVPASLHLPVARACIAHGKNMVTSSYISPALRELDQQAKDKGVTILNEVGLDPGLDHISALKLINEFKEKEGEVVSFQSYCGGLPAPEASGNPVGYKFSWSPRGALLAAKAGARYKALDRTVEIPPGEVFLHSKPFEAFPGFNLEGYPNRDSVSYQDLYGLHGAKTFIRGTLRYSGFATVFNALNKLGYLSEEINERLGPDQPDLTWRELTQQLLPGVSALDLPLAALRKSNLLGSDKASKVSSALQWLGLFSDEPVDKQRTVLDSFCRLLLKKLSYERGERDVVILHHSFHVKYPQSEELVTSSLVMYGDDQHSAMAKTVGLPVVIASKAILSGLIIRRGVIAPLTPDIYMPIYSQLDKYGISFRETATRIR